MVGIVISSFFVHDCRKRNPASIDVANSKFFILIVFMILAQTYPYEFMEEFS
jgi:hypothetical protein